MKNEYKTIHANPLPALGLWFILAIWLSTSLGQDMTAPEPQDTWARYQVILQRNIFSRQRGPIRQSQRIIESRPVVTPNPESYFLLKGIVQEGPTFIAFFEDVQSNGILRLREGDSVARGTVENFTLDSVEYKRAEQVVSVALGQDLEGGVGAVTMSRLLQLPATSSATSDPNATVVEPTLAGDEAEILKQLMEKRKQQLGQ
jgi:hypothetical protein